MRSPKILAVLAIIAGKAIATPVSVYPEQDPKFTQSLNGEWPFKYLVGLEAGADAGFSAPDFDVSAWKKIHVPSNWELQGFAEPQYDLKLADGLGLYRRTFQIPASWRDGRRICLRFEGVAFGFDCWVNGKKVGSSTASAYNPDTFDITDALLANPQAKNVLAVEVTTKPLAYEFDVNDDWSLSGIFRDVSVFSVPATHVEEVFTHTTLAADGTADLTVAVKTSQPGGALHGELSTLDGKEPQTFDLSVQQDGHYAALVQVKNPRLWTAETPALYHLQLTLSEKGRPVQTLATRLGLREISIKDGVLRLNGQPIKLHGVDHHDESPETGRATTEAQMRRDLDLMRKGNINLVRCSHYPPNLRFLELCDELGFYVLDEVAIGKGEAHDNDPAYRDNIMARVQATITRDQNHPSVLVWDIGNENPVTDLLLDAGRYAKQLDPSRPICYPAIGSYFAKNYQHYPDFVDIYAPHYPSNALLRDFAKELKRPVILTEYAHANGLATDRIQDQWEMLQATPGFAGGAIWHFMDQGLLRTSPVDVDPHKAPPAVWLSKTRYYDTHGLDGEDGIVYADRTPQTDFWEARKVYAPVQIAESTAAVSPGAQSIPLTVENRYDFRALTGIKLAWSLQRNGKELQQGEVPLHAAAHEKETLHVPVNIPADAAADVLALSVRCIDETGLQLNERTLRLDLPDAHRADWLATLPSDGTPKVSETDATVKIENAQWGLTVTRATGVLTISDHAGRELVSGIYPHAGRQLTDPEKMRAKSSGVWRASTLESVSSPVVKISTQGSSVHLEVSGAYPRPDDPQQSLVGGYQADITPGGAITFHYDYAPTNAKGLLPEAGLSVVLPAGTTELRWIGQGPYAGYPGKDRLNEFGLFHLNADDLYFRGNRRGTELALLASPAGVGVALATEPGDVSVERHGAQMLLSHNAVISGLGNKGSGPETKVDAQTTPHISGRFTLVPLEKTWPAALTRWFGNPADPVKVFKPFYSSYDQ